jgi:hypothetical protein
MDPDDEIQQRTLLSWAIAISAVGLGVGALVLLYLMLPILLGPFIGGD